MNISINCLNYWCENQKRKFPNDIGILCIHSIRQFRDVREALYHLLVVAKLPIFYCGSELCSDTAKGVIL